MGVRARRDGAPGRGGRQLVDQTLRRGRPGRFALQAAIAAVHAEAPATPTPTGRKVLGLYDLLLAVWPSPVVALNRAVAVAMVQGPAAGLAALEEVADDPHLATYPYLAATRADLLRRLGHALTPPRPTEPRSPWPATPPRKTSSPDASPRSPAT